MKKERYCFYKDQGYQEAFPRLGETFKFFFLRFICLFLWLYWIFAAVQGLSLVVASYSLVAVCRPLISLVSLVAAQALGMWGSVVTVCGLKVMAPGALECAPVAVVHNRHS